MLASDSATPACCAQARTTACCLAASTASVLAYSAKVMPSPVTAAFQSTSGMLAVTLSQTIPSQNRYSSQVTVWPLMASISPSGCRPLA